MKALIRTMVRVFEKMRWIAPLLARVTVGVIFIQSGWGKFHDLPRVIGFFTDLGIPAPQIQAPFVAGVELLGGALLVLGLFTRIAALPLIGTMVVALMTARREEIHSLPDLFGMIEYLYIVLLIWLVVEGAGPVSLDRARA